MRVGMTTGSGVYWAGRATLVRRPEDVGVYDDTFASFWGEGDAGRRQAPPGRSHEITVQLDAPLPGRGAAVARDADRRSPCATAQRRCCATRTSPPTPATSCTRPAG